MSLVFTGPYTAFHHQCLKMVQMLIDYCEQNMRGLNPYAQPYVPLKQEETETNNNREDEGQECDRKYQPKLDTKLNNDNKNRIVHDKWTHEGRIFRKKNVQKDMYEEKIENVKCSKNANKYDMLNNNDVQEAGNEDSKLEVDSANEMYEVERNVMKENKKKRISVNDMTIDALCDEIQRFRESDLEDNFIDSSTINVKVVNNHNKEDLHEELKIINHTMNQVIIALSCRLQEDLIDIKKVLNIEVISKEGDDLTWCKVNSKWHGTILHVKEIIQLHFNNLERTKLRDKNEYEFQNSVDDDDNSHKCCGDSEDNMSDYDVVYDSDSDCNDDIDS